MSIPGYSRAYLHGSFREFPIAREVYATVILIDPRGDQANRWNIRIGAKASQADRDACRNGP